MDQSRHDAEESQWVMLYHDLQRRVDVLLQELDSFEECLKAHKKEAEVEIRVFKRGVATEAKGLRNVAESLQGGMLPGTVVDESPPTDSSYLHVLKSSNLPFYESIWAVAKDCRRVTALSKKFIYKTTRKRIDRLKHDEPIDRKEAHVARKDQKGILVDVVADNGLEWVKVSTISEKRLLFEIAKEGWDSYANLSEDDGWIEEGIAAKDQGPRQLELVRVAHELQAASRSSRVDFVHPRVRFVLPRIREGLNEDVDAFMAELRATGATVTCGMLQRPDKDCTTGPAHAQPAAFERLLPVNGLLQEAEVVNLDCTILLATVSDISHFGRGQISPNAHALHSTYHSAIMRQIELEETDPMLTNVIFPVVTDKVLRCTSHAARRMREIVQCMGTVTERARAEIILGDGEYEGRDAHGLRQALQEHSNHPVPSALQLPVQLVDFEIGDIWSSSWKCGISTYHVAHRSLELMPLSTINESVFLYGWKEQILTFTSNRVVAMGLLKAINEVLDEIDNEETGESEEAQAIRGPLIHVCDTARSLIGKARNSKEG